MKKLSIIGKDYHTEEHVVGYFNLAHFMAAGCTTRASAKSVGAAGRASAGLPTAGPSMPLLTRMNFRFTQPESE
jgi:hypothetical protein